MLAQTTASIYGTITDETGAAVPHAAVLATNTQTNETRSTASNRIGYYTLLNLPVGSYRLQIEAPGFRAWVREGIELQLNRNARADATLSIGAVTEKVTVLADAPLVESTTAEMGTLVDQRRVVELPLNGRNSLSLVSLAPGAQQLQTGNAQGFVENKVAVNGIRPELSNWLLDGGDNTSSLRNYGNDVPNPDAVQEFRVITSNYDAEYGRSVGAVVNVITKSGTNELHGSLFEFLRNRRLNARDFFQRDTTPLVQNQFGGTLGGPVLRNRLFGFGTYQGFRNRTQAFRNNALVPTALEQAGDFSRSVDRAGRPVVIRDPLTSQQFPNNIIPRERISPVAVKYLELAIPRPNYPANGPNGLAQLASRPKDNDQFLVKLDYIANERHKLSGAYFWSDSIDGGRFLTDIDFARRDIKTRQHNLNLHEYWSISANKLNHFRATFARSAGDRKVLPDDISLNELGGKFSPLPTGPRMPPDFDVLGYFDAGSAFGGAKVANNYTVADTFDWIKDKHNLKAGGELWLRRLFDTSTHPAMGGEFTFDGTATGNSIADLLLGRVSRLNIRNESYKSLNAYAFYWFIEDKYRITPRLLLNLGLRHELNQWPVHPGNQVISYLPGRQSSCVPQAPQGILFACDPGIPRAGILPDRNDLEPRVSIAYDLTGDGKTVVRSGYGVYSAFTIFNTLQGQQVSTPFGYGETIFNTDLADPLAAIGGSPFPFRADPASLKFPAGSTYQYTDFDARNGYVQHFNFTIQRQIGASWSVEAAYAGNVARKLTDTRDDNAPLRGPGATRNNIDQRRPLWPVFKELIATGGFVNSSYNAFQARLEKRFSRGSTILASYTLGKAIDESTWHDDRTAWIDMRNRALNKGLADIDRRHILAVSWVWEVPVKFEHRLAQAFLGGWLVNGIATLYSGQPFLITSDRDNDFDGNARNDRPDVAGDWRLSPNRPRGEVVQRWFTPGAFAVNRSGELGNLGRNVVTGPGLKNIDGGVLKNFRVREGHAVQFRAELFNASNWVNLGQPEARLSRATFGRINATATGPRIVQFGLKYLF
ncbi:MAG: carboxypeptidase regulatory-like domain-containing protein [Acidobacteria bacterium]|nr:carboxypeptidase regulatory-like domain-containing protein [Acidobacteriota bacterium]